MVGDHLWNVVGLAGSTACAVACTIGALWLAQRPLPWRRERIAGVAALCFTALWAGVLAALGGEKGDVSKVAAGEKSKAWRDIWGAGQGVGSIGKVTSTAEAVAQLEREYHEAQQRLAAISTPYGAR